MSKECPNCGENLPDEAHFCGNCGYDFFKKDTSPISVSKQGFDGKMFLVIIAIAVVVLAGIFFAMNSGGNGQTEDADVSEVDLTITEVNGYESSSSNPISYSLYTEAIFNKVPSDQSGYNVRTAYFDANGTEIGFETEKLSNIYYDSDYSLSFGFYTTYKKPNPDHVTVEIIKDGKTIDNFTQKIDHGKIKFLN